MTKVAQLINAFIPCGAENVAKDIALRLDRNRFESIVIAVRHIEEYADQERIFRQLLGHYHVRSYCLRKTPGSLSPFPFLRLLRILWKEKPDILHMHGQLPQLLGLAANIFYGCRKRIITLHTVERWYERPVFKYILKGILIRIFRPDVVSISSTIEKKYHFKHFKKQLIHNGIDISEFHPKKERAIKRHKRIIGTVGRLSPAKGHHVLFDAVRQILNRRDDFEIQVVGDGELRQELVSLAREIRIDSHVRFFGFRNDIKDLYQTFDMLVIPSLWEGLSIVLLEAMASGLPVIATAVSGNIDVVEDGKSGLLVPPNSPDELAKAIETVMDQPIRAAYMGWSARQVIENQFTVQSMVSKYEVLYRQVNMKETWRHRKYAHLTDT